MRITSMSLKRTMAVTLFSSLAVAAYAGGGPNCAIAADQGTSPIANSKAEVPIQRMTVSWDKIRNSPAKIEVVNMTPVILTERPEKNAWSRVPSQLATYQTMIFAPTGAVNGVADYKVTSAGYLLVACNYDYQGNASGDWKEGCWTRADFYTHGWTEATSEDLGGALVNGQNRQQVVFVKKVEAGETGRLRSNKYDPPYFILCSPTVADR